MIIDWEVTDDEQELIHSIAMRAVDLYDQQGVEADVQSVEMDLIACHKYGHPLDLERLESFDDFNLMHDISGINKHLDRNTGKLTRCFLPRCSRPVAIAD